MCLQWGRAQDISIFPDTMTVTFPRAFDNRCAGVVYFSNFSMDDITGIFMGFISIGNITKSNFIISADRKNGGSWLATGY